MEYVDPLFRPPSEAKSLIVQATLGCSWNKCSFCQMYQGKPFRAVPEGELFAFIDEAHERLGRGVRRVFLADGDALCLKTGRLLRILERLRDRFPSFERASLYAYEPNVRRKSDEDLGQLVEAGLSMAYLGLESGDPETLRRIEKGCTAEQMVVAVRRMQASGMTSSVMTLLGLGGLDRSREHARASADVLNQMQPRYVSFLTVTPVEGTRLFEEVQTGTFTPVSPIQSLRELRWIVEDLDLDRSILRSNHASNYLPIGGTLPADKGEILEAIDAALAGRFPLKPEALRGL